ncbi:NAD(P)-binding protein [Mytilinidion resinicola]|uniref:NAD(P)-binding protein n=1 Tax=Mytilinidion resinicola TaxID=574789 RepID=A0A6A6YVX4_9PEZI|nr:NAD(P)-binding protein [Mytilinidion resinicola]KAF2812669.1 NAD(P)-binding protein [Mytilinidion resinicola]
MSTTPPSSILLFGAGELGTAILDALLPYFPNPQNLTLAVRDPSKYTSLTPHKINFLPLDLLTATPASLATHFSAFSVVICANGFGLPPGSQLLIARAALAAGKLRKENGEAPLRFFPWQWGVDYDVTGDAGGLMPLFGEQLAVKELLRAETTEAGVQWMVVSTGIFMSFLFEGAFGVVETVKEEGKGKGKEVVVRALGGWENRVTVTTVEDIGRIAARLVCEPNGVEAGERVVYAASQTISYGELAGVVERVLGRGLRREVWSVEFLKEELGREPESVMRKYRIVFAEGKGVSWGEEETVNRRWGMEVTDVETWARENYRV